MLKTFSAYKSVITSSKLYYTLLFLFLLTNILTSIFVYSVNLDIQEVFLTILSILFPLIAGFLTFGKDTLKGIKNQIQKINENDEIDIGRPVTDSDKRKIRFLKELSSNFIKVVIGTFIVSFILIIVLLIAKFNNYDFKTSNIFFPLNFFFRENIINLFLKTGLFFLLYLMFLNTLYLVIFIIKINKYDDIINS